MKLLIAIVASPFVLVPIFAFAQFTPTDGYTPTDPAEFCAQNPSDPYCRGGSSGGNRDIESFFGNTLTGIINRGIQLLLAILTLVFIYGVVMYISASSSGDQKKAESARSFIVYSIIGFALVLGIWGVASWLTEGLGFKTTAKPSLPSF